MKLVRINHMTKETSYFHVDLSIGLRDLKQLFGMPDDLRDGKTMYKWCLRDLDTGREFTIYNYKGQEWHIGSRDESSSLEFYEHVMRLCNAKCGS